MFTRKNLNNEKKLITVRMIYVYLQDKVKMIERKRKLKRMLLLYDKVMEH